jgi:peptidoglycan DL-endopeptidase CwlO
MPTPSLRRQRLLARLLIAGGLVAVSLGAGPVLRSAAVPRGLEAPASAPSVEDRAVVAPPRPNPVSVSEMRERARERKIRAVLRAAREAIGTPYVYGGERLHHGFDCSGLVQWAWRHAGVSLPRTSYTQRDAVPHVGRHHLQPGDLLFFYHPISHVAIYVGHGRMIEAPHTGLRVRTIPVYWQNLVGAGRPNIVVHVHRRADRRAAPALPNHRLRVG